MTPFGGNGPGAVYAGAPSFGGTRRGGWRGIVVVVALHAVLFWALANGLARRIVEVVRSPIQTKLL